MLENVRQGLLHDPICRQVDAWRELDRRAFHTKIHPPPGGTELLDERGHRAEAGLRPYDRRLVIGTQHTE